MELQVSNSCYFSCEIICSWWISVGRISDWTNDSSIKQHSLILQFLKIWQKVLKQDTFGIKIAHDFLFLLVRIISEQRWKNRNKKRLFKICSPRLGWQALSFQWPWVAEIPYGLLTPLLAYSSGRWHEWEYQLISK